MLGDNSAVVPPDPMPNSEVKRSCADDSVRSPHVKVGHRQAPNSKPQSYDWGFNIYNAINIRFFLIIIALWYHLIPCRTQK